MCLASGTRLGPYEVTALIGQGGMGEVYRAHDTKLHRDVALKVGWPGFDGEDRQLHRQVNLETSQGGLSSCNYDHALCPPPSRS